MDMGPGSLLGLTRAGVDTKDLHGILITHRHADHCCELAWLLQLERSKGRTEALRIAAPGIFKEYLDFFRTWGRSTPQPDTFPLEFLTMPGHVTWASMEIEGRYVPHVEHSVGYRIRCNGKNLSYTGDTGPGQELIELAKDADLLLSECTLPTGSKSKVHLNPEQVTRLASRAGVKKVMLSHFPPGADTGSAALSCRNSGIETMLAKDGLRIEIS